MREIEYSFMHILALFSSAIATATVIIIIYLWDAMNRLFSYHLGDSEMKQFDVEMNE